MEAATANPTFSPRVRPLAGIAIAVFSVLWSALAMYGWPAAPPPPMRAHDIAHAVDQRIGALRAALPQDAVIGYWSDLPDWTFVVGFSIAPVVIDAAKPAAYSLLVIDRYPNATVKNATPPTDGYHQVRDFGQGLTLWERDAP